MVSFQSTLQTADSRDGERRLLAVAAAPPWPVIDGYSLRVHHLLSGLSRLWSTTIVAPPMRTDSNWPLASSVRYEAVGIEPRWARLAFQPEDRERFRDRALEVATSVGPTAVLLWNGADYLALDRRLTGVVVDRIDSLALMAWRSRKEVSRPIDKLRAVRKALTFGKYERRVVRNSAATVVVGKDDARALRLFSGRSTIHVVGNGVTLGRSGAVNGEAEQPTVIFTGVMSYRPNVEAVSFFVHNVWPTVHRRVPEARFVIAGRSPSERVVELGSVPGIDVAGEVADLGARIRQAWIAVAPMRSGTGIKNKVLEAWAESRPVVMSGLASNGLSLDPEARELVADDPDEFANKVVGLLGSAEQRRRYAAAGFALAEREHSWTAAVEAFHELLTTRALDRSGSPSL